MKRLFLLILLIISVCGFAQIDKVIPAVPNPPKLVNDYTNLLTKEQSDYLESKLVAYDDTTSNQFVILIVKDLGGYDANEYATALGRKWGVGGKEFDNGVVILISTGGDEGNRDAYIAPGYGLEGAIPDITAKTILENELIPNLKIGEYYRGLDQTVDALIKAAAGEYKAPQGYGKRSDKGPGVFKIILLMIVIWVLLGIFSRRGGGGGMMSRRGYRGWGGPFWAGSGGGWSGGSGWSGGGSGGGGFGGFGGGSFGGGGAGGKW